MAQCGKRRGGCNTPESLARARAEAQKAHDKWVREYIAKQKMASVTPKAFKNNPRAFWIVSGVTALGVVGFILLRKSK